MEITPPARFPLPRLRDLWDGREVFLRFGTRDIKLRYRQTALGVSWVIVQPLLAAGIFSVVFGGVANLSSDGVPYFIFAMCGLLAWNVFNGIVGRASSSLVANQALVSKVFFPRMLVPLSTLLSVLLDLLVGLALFAVLAAIFQVAPGWPVLLAPIWLLATILLALGVGLMASALMVPYRDMQYIVPYGLQILLYASPVAYSLSSVPDSLRWLYDLNPLTWLLEGFRWSLLGLAPPPFWASAICILASVLVFLAGTVIFEKFERGFADII